MLTNPDGEAQARPPTQLLSTKRAVLFFARDFLSVEFPKLKDNFGDLVRIYLTTTTQEAAAVREIDSHAEIFVLSDYIISPEPSRRVGSRLPEERFSHDRFIPRLSESKRTDLYHGLEALLNDIREKYVIHLYLDEPVSGYINESLTEWVTAQGGLPCHFHTSWVPNHIFFTQDKAQLHPIPLNLMSGGKALVAAHLEKRSKGSGKPLYVHDYSSHVKLMKSAISVAAKGVYRVLRRDPFFMNRDPWPHFFHAKCLLCALFGRYTVLNELEADAAKSIVVPLHYEPEAVLGYLWDGGDQTKLVDQLLVKLPAEGVLVLKEHPSQPGALKLSKWSKIVKHPQVRMMSGSDPLEALLKLRATLVSIGSTAVLEAVRLRAPVFVVGYPHFMNMPGVSHVTDVSSIDLQAPAEAADENTLVDWYAEFLERFCIEGRFMRGNTQIARTEAVFAALIEQASEIERTDDN